MILIEFGIWVFFSNLAYGFVKLAQTSFAVDSYLPAQVAKREVFGPVAESNFGGMFQTIWRDVSPTVVILILVKIISVAWPRQPVFKKQAQRQVFWLKM